MFSSIISKLQARKSAIIANKKQEYLENSISFSLKENGITIFVHDIPVKVFSPESTIKEAFDYVENLKALSE